MYILGLTAFAHDSAACLMKDSKIIAAAEEERFNREKHTTRFPYEAIRYCLKEANISINDVDHIAISWNPWLGFHYRVLNLLKYFPKSLSSFGDHREKWNNILNTKKHIKKHFPELTSLRSFRFHFVNHHEAHIASTFYTSPFEKSAIYSVDAAGEWATGVFAQGFGLDYRVLSENNYPHSLGFFYGAITQYLGFKACSGEGKVMGLASYGTPRYMKEFNDIVKVYDNGNVELNLKYFQHYLGKDRWYSDELVKLFGPARKSEGEITEFYEDISASLQRRLEEILLFQVNLLHKKTGEKNLCLTGGVALNSVANGRILRESPFENIYLQAAANDSGTALGAALYIAHKKLGYKRDEPLYSVYLGPAFSEEECENALKKANLKYTKEEEVAKKAAKLLSDGKIVGWYQDRMEWGPRALGNRSIMADPRKAEMKDIINAKVKHRESFRPFAPSVLDERRTVYFDTDYPSPFMLLVFNVKEDKKDVIPAICHVDGTGRVQTVNKKVNPKYWNVIKEFENITGVGLILNTSFNVRGEPIVRTPEEAIHCYLTTGMDALVLGKFLTIKE